jgi:hypothetical protein
VHVECWIPAEQLRAFNASIRGVISVESAYFGDDFEGFVPNGFGLKGQDVVAQSLAMAKLREGNRMDFVGEVAANRKAVYLNFLFWAQFDCNAQGVDARQRDLTIADLKNAWDFNHIDIPLPATR